MSLTKILINAIAILAVFHLLTHFFIWNLFPDHVERHNHVLFQVSWKLDDGESKEPQPQDDIAAQQQQEEEEEPADIGYGDPPPKNHPAAKKFKLQLLQNERKRVLPTAYTISPYLQHPLFQGKEQLLTMLHEAHFFNDSAHDFFQDESKVEALASKLPLWKTITDRLGGEEPVIVGLDTCQAFRDKVAPKDRFLGVAGMFATGTNLLASLLVANCQNTERIKYYQGTGVRWQVNWGKHSPARYRLENLLDSALNNEHYMPIVTTRHPNSWMQSLCRSRYSTHWFHNAQEHCPNLIPNHIDFKWYNFTKKYGKRGVHSLYQDPWLRDNLLDFANFTLDSQVVPVRVRYKSGTLYHESLAHMWNEWYHEYVDADFPRVIVRLEDLVFHAKNVTTRVCECIGGTMRGDFQYITETAKVGDDNIHGKDRTNLIKWFTRWHLEDRTKNMTLDDQLYARKALDDDLMKLFQYEHPEFSGNVDETEA